MNLIPDSIDWRQYEEETDHAAKVKPASAFLAAMIDDIGKPEALERQAFLPWAKTHRFFAFRDGETTLWAGVNGHGKSELTGMVCSSLVSQGERVCIASFEMKPRKTLGRMVRQFMGVGGSELADSMQRELYEQFQALCDAKLWLYDQQGTVTPARAVAVTRYCFKELGIKHMVLDSLMKCVRGEDDYNGQKDLLDELTAVARDYNAHVHLVHHLKKLDRETDQPDKSHVKGSGAIVDQVDNLLLVWRNKQKELDTAAGKQVDPESPDTLLLCRKQRNGTGWEGAIRLYYDAESKQFASNPGAAVNMFAWPHAEHARWASRAPAFSGAAA